MELGIQDLSVFGVGSLVGALGAWIGVIWKTSKEIQKLEGEITKLAGDIVRDLQKSRKDYVDACAKTTRAARDLRKTILESPDDLSSIDDLRLVLSDTFTEQAMPQHHDYCQWEALRLKQESDKLYEFITDEVVFELRRFKKWLDQINNPSFLENLNRNALTINRRTLRPYYELPLDLPEPQKSAAENFLRSECAKLIDDV